MKKPITPPPRRKVTMTAATRPRPPDERHEGHEQHQAGHHAAGCETESERHRHDEQQHVMRMGMKNRSNAAEPACTVVGDVGVTSSASSVPISRSSRIAVETSGAAARSR